MFPRILLVGVLTAFLCALVAPRGGAQEFLLELPDVSPFLSAQKAFEAARGATKPAELRGHLREAVAQYQAAIRAGEHVATSQARLTQCLVLLVDLAENERDRAQAIAAAGEAVQAAAAREDAGYREHLQLGSFLTRFAYAAATERAARDAITAQIRAAYRRAIALAGDAAQRSHAQLQLANLLVSVAGEATDPALQRKFYTEADESFQAAAAASPTMIDVNTRAIWGVAALHAGIFAADIVKTRAARDMLATAAEAQPEDVFKQYNLACALAALDEQPAALRLLQRCLERDVNHLVFNAVNRDPEWALIRQTPAFEVLRQKHDPRPDQAHQAAQLAQSSGERASLPELRGEYFRHALEKYAEAVRLRPDFYQANLNWMLCLRNLVGLKGTAEDARQLTQMIRERYQAAAANTGADWRLQQTYGRLLLRDGARLAATDEERHALFKEAAVALETALAQVAFSGERARLENDLATCQVQLARAEPDRTSRRALLESALSRFQRAIDIEAIASTPEVYAIWGVAQLELAKLQNSRLGLRQAIERFRVALEMDPRQTNAHYNLACTYALLGQRADALKYLQAAVGADHSGHFAQLAQSDPDLELLRQDPQFIELLRRRPAAGGAPSFQPDAPRLSPR